MWRFKEIHPVAGCTALTRALPPAEASGIETQAREQITSEFKRALDHAARVLTEREAELVLPSFRQVVHTLELQEAIG